METETAPEKKLNPNVQTGNIDAPFPPEEIELSIEEKDPEVAAVVMPTSIAIKSKSAFAKNKRAKSRHGDIKSVYSRSLITRNVTLPIMNIGKNLRETIERNICQEVEGKCILEGFVKTGSIKIVTYSSGIIQSASVMFEVVFECDVCFPIEGMLVTCVAKNITKAGIRAESSSETPSPFIVFIARDHHYMMPYFSSIEENAKFTARVIGQRFELNDKYVSIIAELVEPKIRDLKRKEGGGGKPRIVF
jgi:DNA-directed RNA polymerase subunit E'/Rpb7